MCVWQGKVSGLASELEATNQKTETRCNGIRKEVSKAMSEQRQQLVAQSEAMAKKMDGIAAKVSYLLLPSVCGLVHLSTRLCLCLTVQQGASVHVSYLYDACDPS